MEYPIYEPHPGHEPGMSEASPPMTIREIPEVSLGFSRIALKQVHQINWPQLSRNVLAYYGEDWETEWPV